MANKHETQVGARWTKTLNSLLPISNSKGAAEALLNTTHLFRHITKIEMHRNTFLIVAEFEDSIDNTGEGTWGTTLVDRPVTNLFLTRCCDSRCPYEVLCCMEPIHNNPTNPVTGKPSLRLRSVCKQKGLAWNEKAPSSSATVTIPGRKMSQYVTIMFVSCSYMFGSCFAICNNHVRIMFVYVWFLFILPRHFPPRRLLATGPWLLLPLKEDASCQLFPKLALLPLHGQLLMPYF